MGSANEVKVSYIADIRDLTAKLQSVSGITASEARKQVASVLAAQKAQTKAVVDAQKEQSNALKATAASANDVAAGGGKALKALGPLGGVLSRISPEAGAAASSIAGLTSAFEGFGLESGAFAGAIGAGLPLLAAGGVAVGELVGVMDDYTAASKAAKAAHDSFAAAMAPMEDAVAAARAEQDRLNAALDSGAPKKYLAISDLSAAADAKEAAATAKLREEKDALMATLAESANMDNFAGQIAQNRIAQIDKEIGVIHGQANELARLSVTNYTLRGAIDASGKATTEHTAKSRDLTAELTKESAAVKRDADAFGARLAAVESSAAAADDVVARSTSLQMSEVEKLGVARDNAISDYLEKAKAGALTEEQIAAGSASIRASYSAEVADQQIADAERVAAAQKAARAARLSDEIAVGNALVALGSQIVSDTTKQYDTTTAAGRKAALKQFRAQKAANLAIGALNTVVGVSTALRDYPVPPMSIIMGGIALASGISAEAAIASSPPPSFHAGYAPDEMQAKILKSEPVVSPVGAEILGRRNIADANAGKTPTAGSGYQGPAPVIIDHQVMEALIKRELANGGALASAMRGNGYGHRRNRRGVTG